MLSLSLAYRSRRQLRLTQESWSSDFLQPSNLQTLALYSVKAAYLTNPIAAIQLVGAGQPANTELHLIVELTGGRISAGGAGNEAGIQLAEELRS